MISNIKLALRYKNSLFDQELDLYIDACKRELALAGIKKEKIDEADATITNVAICYCKWQLNFQGKGEQWEKIYKNLKTSIALDTNYI